MLTGRKNGDFGNWHRRGSAGSPLDDNAYRPLSGRPTGLLPNSGVIRPEPFNFPKPRSGQPHHRQQTRRMDVTPHSRPLGPNHNWGKPCKTTRELLHGRSVPRLATSPLAEDFRDLRMSLPRGPSKRRGPRWIIGQVHGPATAGNIRSRRFWKEWESQ